MNNARNLKFKSRVSFHMDYLRAQFYAGMHYSKLKKTVIIQQ